MNALVGFLMMSSSLTAQFSNSYEDLSSRNTKFILEFNAANSPEDNEKYCAIVAGRLNKKKGNDTYRSSVEVQLSVSGKKPPKSFCILEKAEVLLTDK